MCLVYLDDVLIFGKSFQEHQERLDCVLKALEKAGLTLNVSKCFFATYIIFHLGHIIDENGICSDSIRNLIRNCVELANMQGQPRTFIA